MLLIESEEMISLEQKSINEYKIPSAILMENAAMGFVNALKIERSNMQSEKICVICGKGNNAGDGYAIARLLKLLGNNVCILPLFDTEILLGDAKLNAEITKNMDISFINELTDEYDIIIDAIFGTGFHGTVESPIKEIIKKINSSKAYIASVDIPSGVSLSGDTGDYFVKCDLCVSFGYAKFGQLTGNSQASFKKLIVAPISIPKPNKYYRLINQNTFELLPKREPLSHKGTFGKVLAYTGSYGMAGAAVLSGSAVLKSGAGMLTIACPDDIIPTIVHEFPSAMTLPINENSNITQKAQTMDALLIGCGLGTSPLATKNLNNLTELNLPTVIDADGLNILSENIDIIKDKNAILTPHVAEFSRLSGVTVSDIKQNPVKHLRDFCARTGVCVVLKDAVTLICYGEKLALCHAPNSGMATAGSGDVLAGVIASMLAQGLSLFDAACCGVYVHSASGKLAKETLGEAGMISSDILNFVPKAMMSPTDITPHIKEL